ncbi:unnamed protein product [Urochloa humidicola]
MSASTPSSPSQYAQVASGRLAARLDGAAFSLHVRPAPLFLSMDGAAAPPPPPRTDASGGLAVGQADAVEPPELGTQPHLSSSSSCRHPCAGGAMALCRSGRRTWASTGPAASEPPPALRAPPLRQLRRLRHRVQCRGPPPSPPRRAPATFPSLSPLSCRVQGRGSGGDRGIGDVAGTQGAGEAAARASPLPPPCFLPPCCGAFLPRG